MEYHYRMYHCGVGALSKLETRKQRHRRRRMVRPMEFLVQCSRIEGSGSLL